MRYLKPLIALAVTFGACNQSQQIPRGPVGIFDLARVNDVAVPATVPWDGDSVEFMAAELEIKRDSTYRMTAPRIMRFTDRSHAPVEMLDSFEEGTWASANDSVLQLTPMLNGLNRNFAIPAVLRENTLVTRRPGSVKVWTRR